MADEDVPTPADDEVGITHQPALPELELPEYHGRKPVGMKTSVNGAGNRLSRAHDIDDRVVLVIEARVKKAGHESTDDGLLYAESLKVVDLFEIQGDAGRRLLSGVRQAYRTADDQGKGRKALPITTIDPETGLEVVTDGSGVVLTPADLAEIRGEPLAAMTDDRMTPVVVVFSDGLRNIWPDEFDTDTARPSAGDRFEAEDPEAAQVHVAKLLNAETGETIEEWTDEQENARLLEMETELGQAEARADREATEELLAGRDDVAELGAATEEDREFVGQTVAALKPMIGELTDVARLERILKAEKAGKSRAAIVNAIDDRLVELGTAAPAE